MLFTIGALITVNIPRHGRIAYSSTPLRRTVKTFIYLFSFRIFFFFLFFFKRVSFIFRLFHWCDQEGEIKEQVEQQQIFLCPSAVEET